MKKGHQTSLFTFFIFHVQCKRRSNDEQNAKRKQPRNPTAREPQNLVRSAL